MYLSERARGPLCLNRGAFVYLSLTHHRADLALQKRTWRGRVCLHLNFSLNHDKFSSFQAL